MARRFGAGLTVSEMISSDAMTRKNEKSFKLSKTAREELPLSVQIAGKNPALMAEAARINESMGAAIIDINMGCPSAKDRKHRRRGRAHAG
ncbi:MAG: tRNA-dihydrouridine synthase [Dissulfurimicrobium sp.]|uniref:tRNA-dihydrouridine synthase n=1 Tax=Dissulfurimicrobium sp. TaxID=2022436 RepID=UPI00404948DD